jgi:hypothetical protein
LGKKKKLFRERGRVTSLSEKKVAGKIKSLIFAFAKRKPATVF